MLRLNVNAWRALVASACVMMTTAAEGQVTPPASDIIEVRVLRGDTCTAIARRLYRNGARTDLIHQHNPWMGPPPHRLREGTVLRVPRTIPITAAPDATLTGTHNQVEIYAPDPRRPRGNDPLFRGMRVNTLERSSAEVTFADETQLRLAEQTLVVILGETNTRVRRLATAQDTTLERGELVAFLGALAGRRPVPVRTEAARVMLGEGEARVGVDSERRTTVAVYRGRSQVTAPRQVVPVNAGYGLRAERGRPIPRPRPLPIAPVWVHAPQAIVLTQAATTTLTGEYGPGAAAGPASNASPARWHVQVARDERFLETIVDERAPVERVRLEARDAAAGEYFVRVSAIDAENLEGPASTVARVRVVPVALEAGDRPRASRARLPTGVFCGLDGAALQPTTDAPLEVDRRTEHTLRCAASAEGTDATETTLAPEPAGPLALRSEINVTDARARRGRVTVRVTDAAGNPVARDRVSLALASGDGVTVGALTDGSDATSLGADVTWTRGGAAFALRVTVDGDTSAETERLRAPDDLPVEAPPPRPPERWYHRVAVRTEFGAGSMVFTTVSNDTTPTFGPGYGASLRVGFDLIHPEGWTTGRALALQASASRWAFPATNVLHGFASLFSLGVRFEPVRGRNRLFIDANASLTVTGPLQRPGFEVGVGYEHVVGAPVSIGLFARYVHVLQPGEGVGESDSRFVLGGVTLQRNSLEPSKKVPPLASSFIRTGSARRDGG